MLLGASCFVSILFFLRLFSHSINRVCYCINDITVVWMFSNILFALSISSFGTPFLSFISRFLSSIFSFVVAVRVCKTSSNLSVIILVLSSSLLLLFFRFSYSLLSFSSTFSSILAGSITLICITSGSTSFPSPTAIKLSNDLSLQNLPALSLYVWALVGLSPYIVSHASFILLINPRP